MPRILKALALGLACLALCLCIWWLARGSLAPLGDWAAAHQRDFQNRIAGSLRALRAGEPGAIMALMLVCFAYGFFHAIGPGHGKILVGGYGLARKTPWLRLGGVALLSSLGQAVTAIVLVYGAISLLQLGRDSLIGVAEKTMAPLSYGAIAAIGLWLLLRGARKLWRATGVGSQGGHDLGGSTEPMSGHGHSHSHSHDHNHDHGTSEVCSDCGHRHGPSLEEVSGLQTWREAMVLIAGIAVRPCTGALFVLVITWQMGDCLGWHRWGLCNGAWHCFGDDHGGACRAWPARWGPSYFCPVRPRGADGAHSGNWRRLSGCAGRLWAFVPQSRLKWLKPLGAARCFDLQSWACNLIAPNNLSKGLE